MKSLLITFNLVVFILGNVLVSNIHQFLHHDHDHHHMENVHDCQECIALENLNDCVLNDSELNFSKNEKNQFRYSYSVFFDFDIFQRYLSRAPPIS